MWLPDNSATFNATLAPITRIQLQPNAMRAFYYTSATDDDQRIFDGKQRLWFLGFTPRVYKRSVRAQKAPGVDIALTIAVLKNAYLGNNAVAMRYADNGDYAPATIIHYADR